MRPLTLKMDGVRSYRNSATLDFSDLSLLAIVGDTGAGKSSILEAITYALYSSATWTGQPGELIADGVRTMRVALTFESDGKRWQVTRSMSRDGYPAPVHNLVCEDGGLVVNGRSEVNAFIERLVGLDSKAFLQSVILPQGRFAELLKATPTERGKILQNIFRVDELVSARGSADVLLARWEPRYDTFRTERSLYLEDPKAAAEEAENRRAKSSARQQQLKDLRTTVRHFNDTAETADREADALDALAAILDDRDLTTGAAELGQLAVIAGTMTASRTPVEQALQNARQREQAAAEQLERAARAGVGLQRLTKAEAELEALVREVETTGEEIEQAVSATAALEEARRHAEQLREAADEAEEKSSDARVELTTATELAHQAIEVRDTARNALAVYRSKADEYATRAEDLRTCREDLEARRVEAEAFAVQAVDASSLAETAERRLQEVEKAAAAASASHDCRPGDPCPVCDRELPITWKPLAEPKIEAARRDQAQAARARDKARTDADKAAGRHAAAVELEREAQSAVERAFRVTEEAFGRLAEGTKLTAKQLTARLDDDATVLARVEAAAAKAEALRDQAAVTAGSLRDAATEARTNAKASARYAAERERAVRSSWDKLRKACFAMQTRTAKLPDFARPVVADERALDPSVTPEERSVALGGARVTNALVALCAALVDLRSIEADVARAREEREGLGVQLQDLQARWKREISGPTAKVARRTDKLADRLGAAAARLDQEPPPERPATDEPSDLSTWATAVEKAAVAAAQKLARRGNEQRNKGAKARTEGNKRLTKAGVSSVEELEGEIVAAATTSNVAAREEEIALAQIARVADLDDRIKQGRTFLEDLRAVRDLLASSKFIGFLMHRRQQALLTVATTLLGDTSGGRFGFSQDFQVVDRYSGQPRSTSTLSGGESFLASMALALAMVELAGRAGGRLDSLFLDEGFGSLDSKTLDIAIDTLEGCARAGRLVAVISHVKTVAERIEDVLAVSYSQSDGSSFRMLTPAERVGLVQDDATDAVAGLLG